MRNPWDRLYSAYGFLKKGGINHLDEQFSKQVLEEVETFEDFVMQWLTPERVNSWVHFLPQYTFITNDKGELVVDFVGRFENFETDFEIITKHIGVHVPLIHLNRTKDKKIQSYKEVYTDAMQTKVGELYEKDVNLFNYKF